MQCKKQTVNGMCPSFLSRERKEAKESDNPPRSVFFGRKEAVPIKGISGISLSRERKEAKESDNPQFFFLSLDTKYDTMYNINMR